MKRRCSNDHAKTQYSPAYAEQMQEIDRKLKARNRRWPTIAAVFLLLAGIALLLLMGKNFDFPDRRTCAGLGVLLFVLFVLREIRDYRESKRFAADFYGEMLPTVLKKAYAAYVGEPDPLFFDPAETWRFPTTVTFLALSINGSSFRARGIYRIQREYFKADGHGDKDNDESGQYHISQSLIWKVQPQEHSLKSKPLESLTQEDKTFIETYNEKVDFDSLKLIAI